MSDAAAAVTPSQLANYVQCWAENLSQVLGQIAGSPLACAVLAESPTPTPPAGESDLWIVCALSGGLRGEMCLRLPPAATLRLAGLFMSQPPDSQAALTAEHREAASELWRQVAGLVATALKPHWGELQLRLDTAEAAPSWPASATLWIQVGDAAADPVVLDVRLSAALVAAMRAEKPTSDNPAPPPLVPPGGSQADSKLTLDLLMNVDLAVTLRFGSRRLLLREVLELNPGMVIELDRQVDEPIDVLLDGRVVARGEVVVMNGNYGLRVTEVAPAPAS